MSYYMGDYYRGDYYRGDPGIGSFFKKALGFGASFIPGVGGFVSKAISAIPAPVRKAAATAGTAIIKHPVLSAAGAAGAVTVAGAEAVHMASTPAAAGRAAGMMIRPTGIHYRPSARHLRALAMGLRRAKPRMNPTNARALRRALRRAYGFERLAMKTIHLLHPRKKGRFGGFRRKRKR